MLHLSLPFSPENHCNRRFLLETFLSYFFVKKILLSRHVGYVMDGWISGSAMFVCHTNQIGSTIKHQ